MLTIEFLLDMEPQKYGKRIMFSFSLVFGFVSSEVLHFSIFHV